MGLERYNKLLLELFFLTIPPITFIFVGIAIYTSFLVVSVLPPISLINLLDLTFFRKLNNVIFALSIQKVYTLYTPILQKTIIVSPLVYFLLKQIPADKREAVAKILYFFALIVSIFVFVFPLLEEFSIKNFNIYTYLLPLLISYLLLYSSVVLATGIFKTHHLFKPENSHTK